jgi:L-amino acid N-acyltransferase YncA
VTTAPAALTATTTPRIRPLVEGDWAAVVEVYRQGIESGDATFETVVPGWSEWDAARHPAARLVVEDAGTVLGFAAVTPVSSRAVYRGVAEVMVYVAAAARARGLGRLLLAELVRATEAAGIWTLQAGIFPENRASLALHERLGFRVVGVRERLGRFHDGRWRDVTLLERRSRVTGR